MKTMAIKHNQYATSSPSVTGKDLKLVIYLKYLSNENNKFERRNLLTASLDFTLHYITLHYIPWIQS
jgi:hypothetical protein